MITRLSSPLVLSRLQTFLKLLKEAFLLFRLNDPLRLASSTAFFTLFALPPILILLISALGTIFNNALITGELFHKMTDIVGENVAGQVELILINFINLQGTGWAAALSFLFLTFVATTLFGVVQNSINQLWSVRAKGRRHLKSAVKNRLRALLIIFSSGILFLATLFMDAGFTFLNDHYVLWDKHFQLHLMQVANKLVGFVIETMWFAIIFKFLPYAYIDRRALWVGAALTAFLFLLGKLILGQLLVNSGLGSLYSTSGSVVVLLLFIFYSAMILFFGAAFTKVYAQAEQLSFFPKHFATFYEVRETDHAPF
jgi:membrane protein